MPLPGDADEGGNGVARCDDGDDHLVLFVYFRREGSLRDFAADPPLTSLTPATALRVQRNGSRTVCYDVGARLLWRSAD